MSASSGASPPTDWQQRLKRWSAEHPWAWGLVLGVGLGVAAAAVAGSLRGAVLGLVTFVYVGATGWLGRHWEPARRWRQGIERWSAEHPWEYVAVDSLFYGVTLAIIWWFFTEAALLDTILFGVVMTAFLFLVLAWERKHQ